MEYITELLELITEVIDITGVAILLIGFIKGLIGLFQAEFIQIKTRTLDVDAFQKLRSTIGIYILLALDFIIASDIIKSILHSELYELYSLGIIVVIRTAIRYFLGKEIQQIQSKQE